MPGYQSTLTHHPPLSRKQVDFLKTRVHWGAHLPADVIDGLKAMSKGTVDPPERHTLDSLFTALITLERRETPDGRRLYEGIPSDDATILTYLTTVRAIVTSACRWDT